MQHCSPQMLHFHGLASEWQPLCKKYRVWSGKPMPQKEHCKYLFPMNRHSDESEGCSDPVDVIVPVKKKNWFIQLFDHQIVFKSLIKLCKIFGGFVTVKLLNWLKTALAIFWNSVAKIKKTAKAVYLNNTRILWIYKLIDSTDNNSH